MNSKFYVFGVFMILTMLVASCATMSLNEAVKQGDIDKVKQILERKDGGINARKNGETPLHTAVLEGRIAIAELLIAEGADVNTWDEYGQTPLHTAARVGHTAIAELLIAKGADVNLKREVDGVTPLHVAAEFSHEAIAELMIAKGADVNLKREVDGMTPLHIAAESGLESIVSLLIRKGANDKDGQILLHKAQQKFEESLIRAAGNSSGLPDEFIREMLERNKAENEFLKKICPRGVKKQLNFILGGVFDKQKLRRLMPIWSEL